MNRLSPPQKVRHNVKPQRTESRASDLASRSSSGLSKASSVLSYWEKETLKYQVAHFRLRFVARLLRKLPQRRLLDLGCSGAALKSLLGPHFSYYGCDIASWARQVLGPEFFQQIDFNREYDLSRFAPRQIDVVHIGG